MDECTFDRERVSQPKSEVLSPQFEAGMLLGLQRTSGCGIQKREDGGHIYSTTGGVSTPPILGETARAFTQISRCPFYAQPGLTIATGATDSYGQAEINAKQTPVLQKTQSCSS